jgi:hypothetical protein
MAKPSSIDDPAKQAICGRLNLYGNRSPFANHGPQLLELTALKPTS